MAEIKQINVGGVAYDLKDATARGDVATIKKDYAKKIDLPKNTSDLNNDSGFITKAVNDLTNYYKKSETYTQSEINSKISAIPKFAIEVVNTLPEENISTTTIYLLKSGAESKNLYTEYIYVNSKWEKLGTQTVDLSGYVKEVDLKPLAYKTSGSVAGQSAPVSGDCSGSITVGTTSATANLSGGSAAIGGATLSASGSATVTGSNGSSSVSFAKHTTGNAIKTVTATPTSTNVATPASVSDEILTLGSTSLSYVPSVKTTDDTFLKSLGVATAAAQTWTQDTGSVSVTGTINKGQTASVTGSISYTKPTGGGTFKGTISGTATVAGKDVVFA